MISARMIIERPLKTSPSQATGRAEHAVRALGYSVKHRSPGSLHAVRGGTARSLARISERPLETTVTAVGISDQESRAFVVIQPGGGPSLVADGNVAGMLNDLLMTAQAVNDSFDAVGGGYASLPVLVISPQSATLMSSVLADPAINAMVRGQLRVLVAGIDESFLQGTRITAPQGDTVLDTMGVQALRTLSSYIAGSPGSLPAERQSSAAELAIALCLAEQRLLEPLILEGPVGAELNFVALQLQIRRALPLRLAAICCDCRFEKIINPQYGRIAQRNNRIKKVINVGAAAVLPSATALTLGARIAGNVTLDHGFVCGRCQGLDSYELLATVCPGCGQLRRETVLTVCPNDQCSFDYTARAGDPRPLLHTGWLADPAPTQPGRSQPQPTLQNPTPEASPTPHTGGDADAVPEIGWFPDPAGQPLLRWFDGSAWTGWLTDGNTIVTDAGVSARR